MDLCFFEKLTDGQSYLEDLGKRALYKAIKRIGGGLGTLQSAVDKTEEVAQEILSNFKNVELGKKLEGAAHKTLKETRNSVRAAVGKRAVNAVDGAAHKFLKTIRQARGVE